MSGLEVALIVVGAAVVITGLSVLIMYNRFVRQQTLVTESWGQTDVELTRRHDLIPNLVATVKGYADHERAVLEAVTAARDQAATHRDLTPHARETYEDQLTAATGQLLIRAEAYPDLKASSNFLALQAELVNTEDRIAAARRFYNGNVRALNTRVRTFPSILIASMFGFSEADFFELRDPSVASVPNTTF